MSKDFSNTNLGGTFDVMCFNTSLSLEMYTSEPIFKSSQNNSEMSDVESTCQGLVDDKRISRNLVDALVASMNLHCGLEHYFVVLLGVPRLLVLSFLSGVETKLCVNW